MRRHPASSFLLSLLLCGAACDDGAYTLKADDVGSSVSIWNGYHAGGTEEGAFLSLLAKARTSLPGLSITTLNLPFDNLYSSWQLLVSAGAGPDLFVAPNDSLGSQARKRLLADVSDQLSRVSANGPLAVNGMTYDNTLYGIPVVVKVVGLYYNKSKIATPPQTTDDLMALVKAGKKLGMPPGAYHPFGFFGAFGGKLLDDTGRCVADQGGVADALQYLVDLKATGNATFYASGGDADTDFQTGTIDMIVNGPWILGQYEDSLGSNLGITPLPRGIAAPTPLVGMDGFYVNPNTKNREGAIKLALFLSSPESQQVYAGAGDPPARPDVVVSDPLVKTFSQLTGLVRPQSSFFDQYWGPFGAAISAIMLPANDPKYQDPVTAVQQACAAMNVANGF